MVTVHYERQGNVALITIDRPARRNALDLETLIALRAAQRRATEEAVRVLVLTGARPAFCAGADLSGLEGEDFARALTAVLTGFTVQPFVTMAAIDGAALGAGTQLAIACDLRVATATSRFGIPAAKLGLAVDSWTVERLASLAGASTARAMLLAAVTFLAPELSGFVHRDGDLDVALVWAAEIAELAPLTIAAHKLALEASDHFERAWQAAWASDDLLEGRAAFLEKRAPRFQGR